MLSLRDNAEGTWEEMGRGACGNFFFGVVGYGKKEEKGSCGQEEDR